MRAQSAESLDFVSIGQEIYQLCAELFPICRSLTGDGVRQTLRVIQRHLPQLAIHEAASGTKCFDWTVPNEWNIRDAYIVAPNGEKIVDFKKSNLHVVGYSVPVDREIGLDELQQHLHSLPELPKAIPYITSYYRPQWGFCLTHELRQKLKPGMYKVKIDSTLAPGTLTYADLLIPATEESKGEILLSTYMCHPSLGNNELSGPTVTTFLAKHLSRLERRHYSYRIVFVPETIGSILYISRNLDWLKKSVMAGFQITCVGDDRCYSYLPSRNGDTLADRIAKHVLKHTDPKYIPYSFLDRGSDERQYCAPGIDLPVATVMRSKYGVYPEYHTSLDDLNFITPSGLAGGFRALFRCLMALEWARTYKSENLCEPQMGKRGLYSSLGTRSIDDAVKMRMDLLAYCDGTRDLVQVADVLGTPIWELAPFANELLSHGLIAEA